MLKRSAIIKCARGVQAMKGATKAVRDKDGNVVLRKSDKEGEAPQATFELKPFDVDPKARYAMGRSLEHMRGVAESSEQFRQDLVAEGLAKKTERLRAKNPAADVATTLQEIEDVEHGLYVKEYSAHLNAEEEVKIHQFDVKLLRLSSNLDITGDILADLMPLLIGELE